MDTRIALAGANPDVYGALMRGWQGGEQRIQDVQRQEDRVGVLGAVKSLYGNSPQGVLAARAPEVLDAHKRAVDEALAMAASASVDLDQSNPDHREQVRNVLMTAAKQAGIEEPPEEAIDAAFSMGMMNRDQAKYGLNPIPFKDAKGNLRLGRTTNQGAGVELVPPVFDEQGNPLTPTEQVTYLNTETAHVPVTRSGGAPAGLPNVPIDVPPEKRPEFMADQTTAVKQAEFSAQAATDAFSSLNKIRTATTNIDEAIRAIDNGADTGPIMEFLPSVQTASVELDNVRGRMGLDIIASTTFGALSKDEREFALSVALPTGLKPPELKAWLKRKKNAQLKMAAQLENAAIFLSQPGATPAKYLESLRTQSGDTQEGESLEYRAKRLGL